MFCVFMCKSIDSLGKVVALDRLDELVGTSDRPKIKIDHILYRGNWNVLDVYSINTQNSDHRPLIAELELA